MSLPYVILLFIIGGLGAGCTTMPKNAVSLQTVPQFDLDRYMGRWNVISALPTWLEKGKVATADIYARRPDGKIDNIFAFRKGSLDAPEQSWRGIAWITNPATNAEWKVRLFWPFAADYRVLELAPDYSWSVVASRGGKWVWILARERSLSPATRSEIDERLRKRGFDPSEFVTVPQLPK